MIGLIFAVVVLVAGGAAIALHQFVLGGILVGAGLFWVFSELF